MVDRMTEMFTRLICKPKFQKINDKSLPLQVQYSHPYREIPPETRKENSCLREEDDACTNDGKNDRKDKTKTLSVITLLLRSH